jgi:dTDP-4-amino-4,6-dideoxygalactose transaminase
MKNIQVLKPYFRVEETLREIKECLEMGWTGMGFKTIEIEEKWKEYTSLPYAHFLNSATSGLHLAMHILKKENNWKDEDEIISTSFTFVSTNHAIRYENLNVVFADIDNSLCLDPVDVEKKITNKTKAIIFVGLGGNTGKYLKIVELCKKYNLKLVLDAAHMAGTRYDGEIPGKEADAVVYSFQAVKNMPTADSGMICFKEEKNDKFARELAWLGINKDTFSRSTSKGEYKWKYDVPNVGFKYHGNSIMASMALVSIKYLDEDNAYRRKLSSYYKNGLKELILEDKIKLISFDDRCETSNHVFQIVIENRDDILTKLNEKNIFPGVHYMLNSEYKSYKEYTGNCPKSHYYGDRVLSLPVHLHMGKDEVIYVCRVLVELLK